MGNITDKERLDYIEENLLDIWHSMFGWCAGADFKEDPVGEERATASNLRECIDKAIERKL